MYLQSGSSKKKRGRRAALVLFVILLFQTTAAAAEATTPVPCFRAPLGHGAVPVLTAGWGVNRVFVFLETAFGNRRRMIQLATLGMCLGLYILMRR